MRGAALLLLFLAACVPPEGAEAPAEGGLPASLAQALAAAGVQADPNDGGADPEEVAEAVAANEEAALADPVGQRWFLTAEGGVRIEDDPYAPRPVRRADYDQNVTLLAPNVALVVQPAIGAPVGVSNMLGAALVRRFAGALRMKEALAAAKVFVIQPRIGGGGSGEDDALIVDWRLRSEKAEDVGLVYASRRLTGAPTEADPWAAFTSGDAEHIAFQTAAHLMETPAIRAALIGARGNAVLERTPSPRAKPGKTPPPPPRPRP